jgi:hypothetical protein
MAEEKVTYTGKVGNGGSQHVEAPVKMPTAKPGESVKKGTDLRSGK